MSSKTIVINDLFIQFKDKLKIEEYFQYVGSNVVGEIEIFCDSKPNIKFKVIISDVYPLKNVSLESISFVNKDLIKYAHINGDGSICFTSLSSPNIEYKLEQDILAMLEWVDKYYVRELDDNHFEYLMHTNADRDNVFLFCDSKNELVTNDFGVSYFSKQAESNSKRTFLLQGFKSRVDNSKNNFEWSSLYCNPYNILKGLYYISNTVPAHIRNFAFNNWQDLEGLFAPDFLKFLNDVRQHIDKRYLLDGKFIMLFYGYPIQDGKFNFESIKINITNIPVSKYGVVKQEIIWSKTVDSTYDMFFGRGKLSNEITNKKVLIIGVGAIGSVLSESLVRGGCKQIALADADIKEVGNICRSKYNFLNGEKLKVDELRLNLMSISPFVEINTMLGYLMPSNLSDGENGKEATSKFLNSFDYVFNCTANNDVSIILDRLELDTNVISISISNHARELLCYIGNKEIYNTTSEIYGTISQDNEDMFNPQGCWSPTFKASHHNISTLVNYALSNLDYKLKNRKPLDTFLLEVNEDDNFTIKLKD